MVTPKKTRRAVARRDREKQRRDQLRAARLLRAKKTAYGVGGGGLVAVVGFGAMAPAAMAAPVSASQPAAVVQTAVASPALVKTAQATEVAPESDEGTEMASGSRTLYTQAGETVSASHKQGAETLDFAVHDSEGNSAADGTLWFKGGGLRGLNAVDIVDGIGTKTMTTLEHFGYEGGEVEAMFFAPLDAQRHEEFGPTAPEPEPEPEPDPAETTETRLTEYGVLTMTITEDWEFAYKSFEGYETTEANGVRNYSSEFNSQGYVEAVDGVWEFTEARVISGQMYDYNTGHGNLGMLTYVPAQWPASAEFISFTGSETSAADGTVVQPSGWEGTAHIMAVDGIWTWANYPAPTSTIYGEVSYGRDADGHLIVSGFEGSANNWNDESFADNEAFRGLGYVVWENGKWEWVNGVVRWSEITQNDGTFLGELHYGEHDGVKRFLQFFGAKTSEADGSAVLIKGWEGIGYVMAEGGKWTWVEGEYVAPEPEQPEEPVREVLDSGTTPLFHKGGQTAEVKWERYNVGPMSFTVTDGNGAPLDGKLYLNAEGRPDGDGWTVTIVDGKAEGKLEALGDAQLIVESFNADGIGEFGVDEPVAEIPAPTDGTVRIANFHGDHQDVKWEWNGEAFTFELRDELGMAPGAGELDFTWEGAGYVAVVRIDSNGTGIHTPRAAYEGQPIEVKEFDPTQNLLRYTPVSEDFAPAVTSGTVKMNQVGGAGVLFVDWTRNEDWVLGYNRFSATIRDDEGNTLPFRGDLTFTWDGIGRDYVARIQDNGIGGLTTPETYTGQQIQISGFTTADGLKYGPGMDVTP
ncbi:hypothetical protein [Citricoccus nitrophenolicus]|uniref:hypothetical protein n=1 Tax=Citricoccus nitrophenolicus TaxID=863575 RepID=UPI0031EF5BC3